MKWKDFFLIKEVLWVFNLWNRLVSFVLRTESIEDVLRKLMSSMTAVLLLHYVCK